MIYDTTDNLCYSPFDDDRDCKECGAPLALDEKDKCEYCQMPEEEREEYAAEERRRIGRLFGKDTVLGITLKKYPNLSAGMRAKCEER